MKSFEREASISSERLPRLRLAVQGRHVSFPAQVPVFSRQNRPDAQWRIVALYFVQGWSLERLAQRYGVTRRRIGQVIRNWVERAAALGYLQRIPPEADTGISAARSRAAASVVYAGGSLLPPAAIVQPHFLQRGTASQAIP
jgi:transposase-like protein